MHALNSHEPIVGRHLIARLRQAAEPLAGRRLKMIDSTAVGGGVAEILHREVPLLEELGCACLSIDRPAGRQEPRIAGDCDR